MTNLNETELEDALVRLKCAVLDLLTRLNNRGVEFETMEVYNIGIIIGGLSRIENFTKEEHEKINKIIAPFYEEKKHIDAV